MVKCAKATQPGRSKTPVLVSSKDTNASHDPAFAFAVIVEGKLVVANIGAWISWTVINWVPVTEFPLWSETDHVLVIW